MSYKTLITALIAVVLSLASHSQTPTVRTRLAVDTITIGDQITLEVDINKDISAEVQVPQFEKNQLSPKIEIVGIPRIDTIQRDGRNMTLRLSYTITSFEAGVHRIMGFPIVYNNRNQNDTIESPDKMELVVQTFDIDTTKQQIVDIKQPLNTPLQWAEIKELVLYSAIGAVLLAIMIYFIIKYVRSRRTKEMARPNEPPHIRAIRELEKLHSEKLPQSGKYKEYYSRLTDTLRTYIESRYGIWAMEMTTPQIIEAITQVNDPKIVSKCGELFSLADLVKFAKWTPDLQECEEAFHTAYYYIEETKVITINTNIQQDA